MHQSKLLLTIGVLGCLARAGSAVANDAHHSHTCREPEADLGTVVSPNAFKVPYLGVDGAFTIDTNELSATDPRNPKRVVFEHMEHFSFYDDLEGFVPIAEGCTYVYRGAASDPYYAETSKGSIWDLFELANEDIEACKRFYHLALRAPHGAPVHMHMRHGDQETTFRKLLALSDGPEDKTKLDPWWSVYCAAGVSGCD